MGTKSKSACFNKSVPYAIDAEPQTVFNTGTNNSYSYIKGMVKGGNFSQYFKYNTIYFCRGPLCNILHYLRCIFFIRH